MPKYEESNENDWKHLMMRTPVNRFDAVSAYMRKMDRCVLNDFLKINYIRYLYKYSYTRAQNVLEAIKKILEPCVAGN